MVFTTTHAWRRSAHSSTIILAMTIRITRFTGQGAGMTLIRRFRTMVIMGIEAVGSSRSITRR